MSTIRGIHRIAFVDSKGKSVKGRRVYYTTAMSGEDCIGEKSEDCYIKVETWDSLSFTPTVGTECVIYYDKNGKVLTLQKQVNEADIDYSGYDTEDEDLMSDD